jgi:hypothetical protein
MTEANEKQGGTAVGVRMTAGPDGIRGSGFHQQKALVALNIRNTIPLSVTCKERGATKPSRSDTPSQRRMGGIASSAMPPHG